MGKVCCKWVSEKMTTRNNTLWKVGVPNELPEKDDLRLCSGDLFHYVKHPLLAVLFKGKHGCSFYTKLYEVKPEGKVVEEWDKCGSTKLTLENELEIPRITDVQRIAFAILFALEVHSEPNFVRWANNWLSGKDRSEKSADIVANAIDAAYWAASYNAAYAAYAAKAATYFANDAAYAFNVAYSVASNPAAKDLDLISLAEKAMEVK